MDVTRWALLLLALPAFSQVRLNVIADRQADVSIDGKPFTTFYFAKENAKPYLAPLRAASGTIVTRRYPMEKIEGESHDHPHHRGLYFAHGDVNGTNFWDDDTSAKNPNRGHIVSTGEVNASTTGSIGILTSHFNWVGKDGKPILREDRIMTFYGGTGRNRMFDIDITLHALQDAVFGDTKEGTFAIRLADAMTELHGGKMTNAQGAQTMANVWGKPSPWVDYAGVINGEKLALAIFDHPANPRHPTTWHARDYGLFAANIFGQHDFQNPAMPNGAMTLHTGQDLRFRYRVLIHPGGTVPSELEKEFKKYAGEK